MRIVGGEHRGRKLTAPDGIETRPTSDRVRESVFNILRTAVLDARVLDVFCGTGAMALESLSRGAKAAFGFECSPAAQKAILKNREACRAQDSFTLIQTAWEKGLSRLSGPFDIVFLDPPYRMRDAYQNVIKALSDGGLLSEDCVIVMEYASNEDVPILPQGFQVYDIRKYGASSVAFAKREGQA